MLITLLPRNKTPYIAQNADHRDRLRDEHDLIGLEIETAGVTNTLPAGVTRGVCDYVDGHKTKEWQPYAAVVAAVYAKDILLTITSRVASTRFGVG